ncbi:hypothetical protein Dsui_3233 [Azospira oryzae PS]|uniref:Uncharacterized protein n=1 Tax=Azospira oryzae (strain ATCC BAA-33 / DSM 13638 / PS) TaxID=640081 RepID=G8QJ96_AZOOP|nr:hypothetical protein [Azospira oryzae]AEV27565.1 hypothetical protein Dsui_3233 [Azospira oryzae PS]
MATKAPAKAATAAKPASKPVAKAAVKPAAKPAAKPVAKVAAKPVAKPAAKQVVAKPAASTKPATKPVAAAKPATKSAAPQRLLGAADLMGALDLADEFYAIAYNIETSLLNGGAVPGQDYTRLDLYQLAQPFVLELFKGNEKFSYVYPAVEVNKP